MPPALRLEIWRLDTYKLLKLLAIPDPIKSSLDFVYRKMQSAKEIHQSIQSVPAGADTSPELSRIGEFLEKSKENIPKIIEDLKKVKA